MTEPTKQETEQAFKVLKAQKGNKTCFDCQARNPTWASITFGVYVCLECSSIHRNMGVHISFVRSTTLDTWQLIQLRAMKVGGNTSATDFFTRHGGGALLRDSDVKKKYTSRVAELYQEELQRRIKEDAVKFPNGIVVEGAESAQLTINPEEEDFFTSWSKPSTPKPPEASSGTSSPKLAPPVVGRTPSPNPPLPAPVPVSPRIVTSSSLRSSTSTASAGRTSKLGAARLNSTPSVAAVSTSTAKKSKLGGLGAMKAPLKIDFAEAERKAIEEAELIKQLGYDRQREEEEEKKRRDAEALLAPTPLNTPVTAINKAGGLKVSTPGYTRLGFGALPTAASPAPAASPALSNSAPDDSPTTAREKFGSQKAISSDMYFGRNAYDPSALSEAQSRLQSFQGATSISSNQYFGREEEDEGGLGGGGADGTLLGDGGLAGLEIAARDTLSKVLANPDVQNVGETIRSSALKLSDYLAQMAER